MSSLARRGLRTTAAAAGIAALGLGITGNAFAAELPALPGADMPELGAPENTLGETLGSAESAMSDADATELFAFEMPSFTMTTPEQDGAAAPAAEESEAPAADESEAPADEADSPAGGLLDLGGLTLPMDGPALPAMPALPDTNNMEFSTDRIGTSEPRFMENPKIETQPNVGAMQMLMEMAGGLG